MPRLRPEAEPTRFPGFDSTGETFELDGRLLRGIYADKVDRVRDILRRCERSGLIGQQLVETREVHDPDPAALGFGAILEHRRIPYVSYPHEWAAPALKDAAVFHCGLFMAIAPEGLTIKDWHPGNILFEGTDPVFVDVTSIIPADELAREPYLRDAPRPRLPLPWDPEGHAVYAMHRGMHLPFFVWPLEMMHRGKHREARRRMFETSLNAGGGTISLAEALPATTPSRWSRSLKEARNLFLLCERGRKGRFFESVRRDENAFEVIAEASDYSSYYRQKGEDFSFDRPQTWTNKQLVVADALKKRNPRSVLDVGSNTGWFSILAARGGAQVVALDVDEVSVAELYREAKQASLAILPLVMDITVQTHDVAVDPSLSRGRPSVVAPTHPLLTKPSARLRCEMALVLGLLHHLALGQGRRFDDVLALLDPWIGRSVIVEFVAADDPLVTGEPSFFPAFDADPRSFGWYSIDALETALRARYRSVEIHSSRPSSRKLLVCDR